MQRRVRSETVSNDIRKPPRTLFHEGVRYDLELDYTVISEDPPLHEGPLYSRADVDKTQYMFFPSLEFWSSSASDTPQFMHRQQMA